jgi:raffinose/stachyose/melibiose transport system permease protein
MRVRRIFLHLFLVSYTVYALGPFLWLAVSSFKPTFQIIADPFALPRVLSLRNYLTLGVSRFWVYYRNSIVVSAGGLLGILIFAATTAYALARFRFPGREWIRSAIFAAILLPPALVALPLFLQMQTYGLVNSRLGLMLVYAAFAMPVSVYILRDFIAHIPWELGDAARVDGANEWQVFLRVILPICRPAITSVLLLQFVHFWNEFVLALVLIRSDDLRTLPVGLTLLNTEYVMNYGAMAAALVLSAAPMLLLFSIFSERFIRGMSAGALKG